MVSHRLVRTIGLLMMCLIILATGMLFFSGTNKIVNTLSIVIKGERPVLDKVEYIKNYFQDVKDIFFRVSIYERENADQMEMLLKEVIDESLELKDLIDGKRRKSVDEFIYSIKCLRIAIATYVEEFKIDPSGSSVGDMEQMINREVKISTDILNKMSNDVRANLRRADINILLTVKEQQRMMWKYVLLGILTGISVAILMGRTLSRQIHQLVDGTKRIARGDLSVKVEVRGSDEISQLADSFNKMTKNMNKAMNDLRQEKSFVQNLVNTAQAIILVLGKEGQIISFNPYFKELTGYKLEEMKGKDWIDNFLPEKERDRIRQVFSKAISDIPTKGEINPIIAKDGREIYVEWYDKTLRDENGKMIGILAIGQDISGRQKTEEELIESQKATLNIMEDLREAYEQLKNAQSKLIQSEKMEAIGRMASAVAHEVKNPLGIVLQGIDYFEEEVPLVQKDKHQMLVMMKESVKRADNIVRTLLDFSRYEKLTIKAEDINSIIEKSLGFVEQKLQTNNIEIFQELGKDMPNIAGDREKIEQILINLFNNAVDAMSGRGQFYVRSYLTRFDKPKNSVGNRENDIFKVGEQAVVVEIEDTGSGMDEDTIRKLFEPFFTTKTRGKGTGLGLAVVKNIMDLHEGLISVESESGKGTKFILKFKLFMGG